jgi:hypothetical protein
MDPGLREELLRMAATDQDGRQRLDCHPRRDGAMSEQELAAAEHLRAVDAANTARMKRIIAERGWPGRSMVGADGAQAAWLLVQHADHDPAFQRACPELLGQAVHADEADARQAAGHRGAKVAELAHTVGRAKTWVYERLQDLHRQGHVERAGHGRWRLIHNPDGEKRRSTN